MPEKFWFNIHATPVKKNKLTLKIGASGEET